jgi:hypothetical protein
MENTPIKIRSHLAEISDHVHDRVLAKKKNWFKLTTAVNIFVLVSAVLLVYNQFQVMLVLKGIHDQQIKLNEFLQAPVVVSNPNFPPPTRLFQTGVFVDLPVKK